MRTIAHVRKYLFACLVLLLSQGLQAISPPVPSFEGYDFRGAKMRYQVSNVDADAIVVDGADKASFQVIESGKPQRYARDKSRMYYRGKVIVGADLDSWTFVNSEYGRDKHGYYANGRRVQGSGFVMLIYNYAKTEKEVFLNGIPLEGADAASFEVWHPTVRTARDKKQIYFKGAPIPKADVATFERVNGYLFKDKRAVYLEGRELQGLDPARLRTSKYETYALDDELVFSGHKLVPRDAATFEELQPPWSKDKFGAYHWDKPIKGADVESFVGKSVGAAQDKNYRYNGERPYCKLNVQAQADIPPCA